VTPESAFRLFNTIALVGWIVLAVGVATRRALLYQTLAGRVFPVGFGVAYMILVATTFGSAEGGFSSLAGVRSLFQSDWVLLAGWIHYLAFDLFVGSWIARKTLERGINRLVLIPILPLTFMFGPVGLVAFAFVDAIAARLSFRPASGPTGEVK
jgi:hypothetical protein